MWYSPLLEKNVIPDFLIKRKIKSLLKQRLAEESAEGAAKVQKRFAHLLAILKASPIATNTQEANDQHYELPTSFYQQILGKNLKYSASYFEADTTTLDEAELKMLHITCVRADLEDKMQILDLGCGWGSLTLYMAAQYPQSQIVAVSNSKTQKEYIDLKATERGLTNIKTITEDINSFTTNQKFDRIVSVEMFEHVRNYEALMEKLANLLKINGKLFVHIFTHLQYAYLFEVKDASDWMSKYFFTGGTMPSDHLLLYFQKQLTIERHWRVNGTHYARTSTQWLSNMDKNKQTIMPILQNIYGADQALKWWVYWRIFFMSCTALWGYNNGNEWFVSHYLFVKDPK
ncbi:MAG: SAM-dependent methyltransferase [Cytophagales bacterium]